MELLQVQNLCRYYGQGDNQVKALDNVSFSVQQGEFIAIVGPSGSGKSTLLHLLGGVDRPTQGKVYIAGNDIYALNETDLAIFRRRHIGLVYQFYNLLPVLTVEENLTLPLLLDNRKPDPEHVAYMAKALGLENRLRHLPGQLSGGQQQRVGIGRALLASPAIMLADEPTGNLDSTAGAEVMQLLQFFHQQHGQTLIIITHDMNIAAAANRIITLADGKILRDEVARK